MADTLSCGDFLLLRFMVVDKKQMIAASSCDHLLRKISVQQHGIAVSGVTCKVAIHSFICDAPAHAEVRRIRHVNYHQGCDKCTVEGIYTKERRTTFNNTKSARRCDSDFDLVLLPNEYRMQDCILRDLQVGMVSQFPIDFMHLTLLGLTVSMPGSTSATGASFEIGTSGLAVATPSSTSAPLSTHPCSMPAQAIPPVTPTVAARDEVI